MVKSINVAKISLTNAINSSLYRKTLSIKYFFSAADQKLIVVGKLYVDR